MGGATKALVTVRAADGTTSFINGEACALSYVELLAGGQRPRESAGPTVMEQRLAVIASGLQTQEVISEGEAIVPLTQAVRGLRQFLEAFNLAKHYGENPSTLPEVKAQDLVDKADVPITNHMDCKDGVKANAGRRRRATGAPGVAGARADDLHERLCVAEEGLSKSLDHLTGQLRDVGTVTVREQENDERRDPGPKNELQTHRAEVGGTTQRLVEELTDDARGVAANVNIKKSHRVNMYGCDICGVLSPEQPIAHYGNMMCRTCLMAS
uniref:Uncharacterized protein n=1 Tax=Alexandrium monilatum TaxID=311494 RepID=A0A7S4QCK7_9DINO